MEFIPIFMMGAFGVFIIIFIAFIIFFITGTSRKGLEKRLTRSMSILAKAQNNVMKNNEDILRQNANITADINKDAIRTMSHAVKEGFTDNNTVYCKNCGQLIDENSWFCKFCGKEQ